MPAEVANDRFKAVIFSRSDVRIGSTAARRFRDQDARQPTLKSGFWTAAIRLLTVTAISCRPNPRRERQDQTSSRPSFAPSDGHPAGLLLPVGLSRIGHSRRTRNIQKISITRRFEFPAISDSRTYFLREFEQWIQVTRGSMLRSTAQQKAASAKVLAHFSGSGHSAGKATRGGSFNLRRPWGPDVTWRSVAQGPTAPVHRSVHR